MECKFDLIEEWSRNGSLLSAPPKYIWARRSDLQGLELRIAFGGVKPYSDNQEGPNGKPVVRDSFTYAIVKLYR